jgi:hypothetical protein
MPDGSVCQGLERISYLRCNPKSKIQKFLCVFV